MRTINCLAAACTLAIVLCALAPGRLSHRGVLPVSHQDHSGTVRTGPSQGSTTSPASGPSKINILFDALALNGSSAHATDQVHHLDGSVQAVTLVRRLQAQLIRVGCYGGPVDGQWSNATRHAIAAFNRSVNVSAVVDKPSEMQLALLQGHGARACELPCDRLPGEADPFACVGRSQSATPVDAPQAVAVRLHDGGVSKPGILQNPQPPGVVRLDGSIAESRGSHRQAYQRPTLVEAEVESRALAHDRIDHTGPDTRTDVSSALGNLPKLTLLPIRPKVVARRYTPVGDAAPPASAPTHRGRSRDVRRTFTDLGANAP